MKKIITSIMMVMVMTMLMGCISESPQNFRRSNQVILNMLTQELRNVEDRRQEFETDAYWYSRYTILREEKIRQWMELNSFINEER